MYSNDLFKNIKNIEIKTNCSVKNFCTFKIGGIAKYIIICNSIKSLKQVCLTCLKNKIQYKILGLGANILFSDNFFDGVIIINKSNRINVDLINNYIAFDSGVSISKAINVSFQKSLSNLEGFTGVPATIGGAIINNLGTNNSSIGDYVEYVDFYLIDVSNKSSISKKQRFYCNECQFAYRNSIFKSLNCIIANVCLKFELKDKQLIKTKMLESLNKKITTQPMNLPSAGSIFLRSNDIIPAKIIDNLKLKGLRIGDAQISTKHSGFIVNLGSATCDDVKRLINAIKTEVYTKLKVNLQTEIEIFEAKN